MVYGARNVARRTVAQSGDLVFYDMPETIYDRPGKLNITTPTAQVQVSEGPKGRQLEHHM